MEKHKLKVSVHKFASCDGCQLAFLNLGEDLLIISDQVEFVHFAEAGILNELADCDVAFVEGSISTEHDIERILQIRKHANQVITIGACATAGGLQALRNSKNLDEWIANIYANPKFINALPESTPVRDHIHVDFELWGCPITGKQILATLHSLQNNVRPTDQSEKVCMECKRQQLPCIMVIDEQPCMGSVTRTGCGALCPAYGKACYSCFGPSETLNTDSLLTHWEGFGIARASGENRLQLIYSQTEAFRKTMP